jgi:hypothetical protein
MRRSKKGVQGVQGVQEAGPGWPNGLFRAKQVVEKCRLVQWVRTKAVPLQTLRHGALWVPLLELL